MKIVKYNKLVRDNIPEIIKSNGSECEISILEDEAYINKLKEKLIEESNEVLNASKEEIVGELADVLEIIGAIEDFYSISHNEVLIKQNKKALSNGRFTKRILLTEVKEKS